jgi:hypothetical protein
MKLGRLLHSSRFHFWATIMWCLLIPPTILWWRDSVFWVALMSLYANLIGHWSSYQAARVEEAMKKRVRS